MFTIVLTKVATGRIKYSEGPHAARGP